MATIAGIVNPFWIYGAYSLLAQQLVERLGVPKPALFLSSVTKRIEEMPKALIGDSDSYWREFARGLISSTAPNASLPINVVQLGHAVVLKATS